MVPKIIIHGGFFSESHTDEVTKKAKQQAMEDIVRRSYGYLLQHTALETVVYAVSLLEDCDLFNAGTGSQIQSDGAIRMSAAVMDGISMKFAGVINIEDVQNPVQVAATLLQKEDSILGGTGALDYARSIGIPYYNPEIPQRRSEYEAKKGSAGLGTVGCVALDAGGNLATATSTGGKGFEIPGRISDSATTAGNFVNKYCGVSCTGVGEDIIRVALATKIVTRVTDGFDMEEAYRRSFDELKSFDGFAGAIALDREGNFGHADSHPSMVYAWYDGVNLGMFGNETLSAVSS